MKRIQWGYKLVLRKNKEASIPEIEQMLNRVGDNGFEFCGVMHDYSSNLQILVFKFPKKLIESEN